MKSKAERQAEFERREEIRKATYAAKMDAIHANAADDKAERDAKYGPAIAEAARQKEARAAARDEQDLQLLAGVKARKEAPIEPVGDDPLVALVLVADWNRNRKAKKRLRRRGLL